MASPDYTVYAPVKGHDGKTHWKAAGAGWDRISQAGVAFISVKIDLIPLSGWVGDLVLHYTYETNAAGIKILKRGKGSSPDDGEIPF